MEGSNPQKVICCVDRRECIKGHPLYIASLAMNLASISRGLSPGEEWRSYPLYRRLWKRWAWCRFAVFDDVPEGYDDITQLAVSGYAEFLAVKFNEDPEKFVRSWK